jgi:flagellar biosynthesis protein FliR
LLFIFIRVGIIFAFVPFFSAEIIPRRLTTTIAFFLSLVLMPIVPPLQVKLEQMNILMLLGILLHETLIGMAIGLGIDVIYSGIQIAGELIGFQMGFSIANVVDPMSGISAPIISNVLYITAFLLFFAFGGHHLLIKAMVESFVIIPIGDHMVRKEFMMAVITYASQMFIIGVKVAAPAIGILLLINVSFAVIARALPQMNVFIMSFPITVSIGLVFTALIIKMMPMFMESALERAWAFMKASMALF